MNKFTDEQLTALRTHIKEYADENLIHDRKSRKLYACPYCDSGHGTSNNSDGAFSVDMKTYRFKCFSCNRTGDLFDLIGQVEKIGNFTDQVNRAVSLYGTEPAETVQHDQISHGNIHTGMTEEQKEIAKEYIRQCRNNSDKTEYFHQRGLSDSIVQRFSLGYDELNRLITIPYGTGTYYITRKIDEKAYRKPSTETHGTEPVFNQSALYNADKLPVFVCEGAMDALSVMSAGGVAVATGGTSHGNLLQAIKEKRPDTTMIICYDNDEAGRKGSENLSRDLTELNIPHVIASYPAGTACKDVNDLLREDVQDYLSQTGKTAYAGEQISHVKTEKFVRDMLENARTQANIQENQMSNESETDHKTDEVQLAIQSSNVLEYITSNGFENDLDRFRKTSSKITGFEKLDQETGGLYSGLYIVGAVSSLGKTTFIHQMADQMAERGETVLYFSMEQSRAEMVSKSLNRHVAKTNGCTLGINKEISSLKIRKGTLSEKVTKMVYEAIKKYQTYAERVNIVQTGFSSDISFIENVTNTFIQEKGVTPIVFIDYLQIIDIEGNMTDRQRIDNIIKKLKKIQLQHGLTMIVISSLNRSNYTTAIDFESFKESGLIEYSADVVWGLQSSAIHQIEEKKDDKVSEKREIMQKAKADTPRKIELVCLKNRYGISNFTKYFEYYTQCDYFIESADQETATVKKITSDDIMKKKKR